MLRFHEQVVDSTSSRAAALAAAHPDTPLAVSAEVQTAGRGRSGRTWQSPAGGAWFSVAWPAPRSPMAMEAAPLVAGLAVVESLAELVDAPQRLALKWPNDVLLDGRKVAGILCERTLRPNTATSTGSGAAASAGGHTVIIGIGINVNLPAAALGAELRHPATSLLDALGHPVDVAALVDACVARLATRLAALVESGFTPIDTEAIDARLAWRGERVVLRQGETAIEGVVQGVDARGRLILTVDGAPVAFDAGEVERVRPAPTVGALSAP